MALVLSTVMFGCGDGGASGATSASAAARGSANPAGSQSAAAKASAAPSASAAASAAPAASGSAVAAGPSIDLGVLGGADWKAAFAGPMPVEVKYSSGGGLTDGDYTRKTPYVDPPWKFGAAGGGGVFRAPSGKALVVKNINLKQDATAKSVDLWIKSGLVTDVKHVGEPEILEVGPAKTVAKVGAGTCKMKGGEAADFYWWDIYSVGDFAHDLAIVVVAKDAPEDDKKVALAVIRGPQFTDRAKPHYKLK